MASNGERSADSSFDAAARRVCAGVGVVGDYEVVARSVVEALNAGDPVLPLLAPSERREALVQLILQEATGAETPALHRLVANHDSAGVKGLVPAAAALLAPILADLVNDGEDRPAFVLALLVLRSGLDGHLDDPVIRRLHLRKVADFTSAQMSLPYSCAFGTTFDRNRSDLQTALGSGEPDDPTLGLPLVHRLIFEWLTGRPMVDMASTLETYAEPDRCRSTSVDENLSAARSLALRHMLDGPFVEGLDTEDQTYSQLWAQRAAWVDKLGIDDAPSGALARLGDRRITAPLAVSNLIAQRLPYLKLPGRRRPRIAVCISGQLRGYEQTLETWRRTILRTADCELFVHTWSNVGRSGGEGFRSVLPFAGQAFGDNYRQISVRIGHPQMVERYPQLFSELRQGSTVTADSIRAAYETPHVVVQDESSPEFDGWTNQDKMHWKIHECHQLAMSAAGDFDLIMRIRPDKPIRFTALRWRDAYDVCSRAPKIFADREAGVHYAHLVIGDQFALGSAPAMELYAQCWSQYPKLAQSRLFDCGPEFAGHSSLAQVCWTHGVEVLRAPIGFGGLSDAELMATEDIERCLLEDAAGRGDSDDSTLLNAISSDVRRTAPRRARQADRSRVSAKLNSHVDVEQS